jgi:hypothetical protein
MLNFINVIKRYRDLSVRSSVKGTKDSSNLIGLEQKSVCWTFMLQATKEWTMPSKVPTWQYFLWVLAPRIYSMEESLSKTRIETQTLLWQTIFFSKLIQTLQFMYFNLKGQPYNSVSNTLSKTWRLIYISKSHFYLDHILEKVGGSSTVLDGWETIGLRCVITWMKFGWKRPNLEAWAV